MAPEADDDHSGSSTTSLPTVIQPQSLAHVVLKTPAWQFDVMKTYYKTFLGARVAWENDMLCYLAYDDEHHRVGIFAMPGTEPKTPTSAGLAHLCFTFATLRDLATSYHQRKAYGIKPSWCVNHGPTTSMYYTDPDGNEVETQVWNYDDLTDAKKFLETENFRMNPIGTDFDPEELIRRLDSGEDEGAIKKRIEIGPRKMP